jgi:hypothetical protein
LEEFVATPVGRRNEKVTLVAKTTSGPSVAVGHSLPEVELEVTRMAGMDGSSISFSSKEFPSPRHGSPEKMLGSEHDGKDLESATV